MLVMSALVFVGVYAIGNPVEMLISPEADQLEREQCASSARPRPAAVAAVSACSSTTRCTAISAAFVHGQPAMELIFERMPATLELAVAALILSLAIGMPLGIYAGLQPDALAAQGDHGRLDPRLLAAELLGRADADHGLRRAAAIWLPRRRARRDASSVFGVELVAS